MKIYLLRHGATDWAEEGRIQGHTDNPLNANGKSQAASAGCFFARMNERIDIIVSSPLLRAFQSAEIVADRIGYGKEKILVESAFIERCFGYMEGYTPPEWENFSDEKKVEIILQKGNSESVDELCTRGGAALRKYVETYPGKTLLIVAHSSIIKATLTAATNGKEPYNPGASAFGTGEFCLLEYDMHTFSVAKVFRQAEISGNIA